MAYVTGTATNLADLLDQIVAFCESNGWTRDSYAVSGTGKRWHAHNGSVYVNFKALINENSNSGILSGAGGAIYSLLFNVGTGYSGASNYYNQAGVPVSSGGKDVTRGMAHLQGSNMAYHLFAQNGGASIFVVVEYTSGYYQFLSFGSIDKWGAYTGGEYMAASGDGVTDNTFGGFASAQLMGFFGVSLGYPQSLQGNGLITIDVDAETGWHEALSALTNPRKITGLDSAIFYPAHGIQPNTLNGLQVFRPVLPMIQRSTSGTIPLSFIGQLPGVFTCTLQSLVPGQQVTLGSDDYRVFPFAKKATSDVGPSGAAAGTSGVLGFAVKE